MEAHSLQVALARSVVKKKPYYSRTLSQRIEFTMCAIAPHPPPSADVLWTVLWISDINTMQESGTRGEGLLLLYADRVGVAVRFCFARFN